MSETGSGNRSGTKQGMALIDQGMSPTAGNEGSTVSAGLTWTVLDGFGASAARRHQSSLTPSRAKAGLALHISVWMRGPHRVSRLRS